MAENEIGDDEFTDEELEELFGEGLQTTPSAKLETPEATSEDDKIEQTQAFSRRLRERTDKAVAAERERIAIEAGYESYAKMLEDRQNKLLKDNGINPDRANPVIDQLVKEKIDSDPRMKELDALHQQQAESFAKEELKALSKLVGQEFTSLDQVPKDVIEDWKKSGSIKQSYIKLHGEELIAKVRKAQTAGTTDHMRSTGTAANISAGDYRPLNDEEKRAWRQMMPGITEEELNKKTTRRRN